MTEGIWDILMQAGQENRTLYIVSVPQIVGHGFVNFGSAWVEPMDIMRVSLWSHMALSEVEALRELKQLQGMQWTQ
jgi:hypothetical protein